MPPVDADQVRRIARLARLELTDAEIEQFRPQLAAILAYFDQLQQIDTTGVEPLSHPLPISNVVREDIPQPSLPTETALQNAAQREGDFFRVPTVIDHGSA